MVCLEEIYKAYFECRKNKRGSNSAMEFEINYEEKCIELCRRVNDRTYQPAKSIAFIVTKPRYREVFAADFSDRVLHHFADGKLRPLLEEQFIDKTCNNRVNKGASAFVKYLKNDIIEASANYTQDCFVAKMDIQGFFMSVSKPLLTRRILAFIDERYSGKDREDVKWLVAKIVNDNPEKHCILRSPSSLWNRLDKNKSLFWVNDDLGLPIGNLPSQLLTTFYLDEFDHYVTESLGFKHYGRYVDDFYIVHNDKYAILESIPLIREKLKEVGLTLHPRKFYIQHYSKGVELVGSVIKPGRAYVHNRTVYNAMQAIRKFNQIGNPEPHVEEFAAVLNSYLGFMKHVESYNMRKKIVQEIASPWWKYIYASAHYYKIAVKKEYRKGNVAKNMIISKYQKHKNQRNGRLTRTYQ